MTNWKYILIIVILATIVGGGILWWTEKQEIPTEVLQITEEEVGEIVEEIKEITGEELADQKRECAESEDPNSCYLSLAKELKDPLICEEIKYFTLRTTCYEKILEFFVSLEDYQLCDKFSGEDKFSNELGQQNQLYCYEKMAIFLKDFSVCNKIQILPYKNSCLIKVAYELKEPSVCNYLVKAEFGMEDMTNLGYDTFYSSRWKDLGSKQAKEDCIQISQPSEPWQAYQNEKYGWEISFPNDFLTRKPLLYGAGVTPESPEGVIRSYWPGVQKYYVGFFWVDINELTEEQALEEWVVDKCYSVWGLKEEDFERVFPGGEFRESDEWPRDIDIPAPVNFVKKTTIGENIPTIESRGSIWQVVDYVAYYVKHNNAVITIRATGKSIDSLLLGQILSTFRFLE